jgi:hypothetical protein
MSDHVDGPRSVGDPAADLSDLFAFTIDHARRFLRYQSIAGMPVSHYTGMLQVKPKGNGCVVEWRAQFLARHRSDRAVKDLVSTLFTTGLESLKSRFGVAA